MLLLVISIIHALAGYVLGLYLKVFVLIPILSIVILESILLGSTWISVLTYAIVLCTALQAGFLLSARLSEPKRSAAAQKPTIPGLS
jgi:hypothetical protein